MSLVGPLARTTPSPIRKRRIRVETSKKALRTIFPDSQVIAGPGTRVSANSRVRIVGKDSTAAPSVKKRGTPQTDVIPVTMSPDVAVATTMEGIGIGPDHLEPREQVEGTDPKTNTINATHVTGDPPAPPPPCPRVSMEFSTEPVTPVKPDRLEVCLQGCSHPYTDTIIKGFKHGFMINFCGSETTYVARNSAMALKRWSWLFYFLKRYIF